MKTTQVLLVLLLLWCQDTESLTHQLVNLGKNVTLDCQIDNREIYWVFQKPSHSPVVILRTFTPDSTSPQIPEERFKGKYSSLTLSRLFISNITIDELGIYYCAKTGSFLQISNGTRLYINEPANDQNHTESNKEGQQLENSVNIQTILTFTSFLLNVVFIITITGLLLLRFKKPKSRQHRHNVEPEPPEDLNDAQYSEIELPELSRRKSQMSGTYVLLQKPNPHPT